MLNAALGVSLLAIAGVCLKVQYWTARVRRVGSVGDRSRRC